jgi:hypothetical protein
MIVGSIPPGSPFYSPYHCGVISRWVLEAFQVPIV